MTYHITLSDQEDAAAAKRGTDPERLLHEMIRRLQIASERTRPLTARELAERQ